MSMSKTVLLLAQTDLDESVRRAIWNGRVCATHVLMVPYSLLEPPDLKTLQNHLNQTHPDTGHELRVMNSDAAGMNPTRELNDLVATVETSGIPLATFTMLYTIEGFPSDAWKAALTRMNKLDIIVVARRCKIADVATPQSCGIAQLFNSVVDRVHRWLHNDQNVEYAERDDWHLLDDQEEDKQRSIVVGEAFF